MGIQKYVQNQRKEYKKIYENESTLFDEAP